MNLYNRGEKEKALQKDIEDTLSRWESGTDSVGDGFSILRWARKGLLDFKQKD